MKMLHVDFPVPCLPAPATPTSLLFHPILPYNPLPAVWCAAHPRPIPFHSVPTLNTRHTTHSIPVPTTSTPYCCYTAAIAASQPTKPHQVHARARIGHRFLSSHPTTAVSLEGACSFFLCVQSWRYGEISAFHRTAPSLAADPDSDFDSGPPLLLLLILTRPVCPTKSKSKSHFVQRPSLPRVSRPCHRC